MKKKSENKRLLRWSLFIIGSLILTFGARILLFSNLGVGGVDAIAIGLAEWTGMSMGSMIIGVGCLNIMIANWINRTFSIKPLGVSILFGWLYDLWGTVLFNQLYLIIPNALAGYIFLLGIVIAPFGAALYILSQIGVGPVDYLMLAIRNKKGASIQTSRILLEATYVLIGWMVRGPIGIGTICIMLFWGPILQVYYKMLDKIVKKYI